MTRRLQLATPAQRAAHRQRVAERTAREQNEHDTILRRVLEARSELTAQDFDILVIPTGIDKISTLPVERIEKYAAHLKQIITEADNTPDASTARSDQNMRERAETVETKFSAESSLRAISNSLCAMCKGGCCTAGGNVAFITSATIRRVKEQMPDLSNEDILQAYLSRLSAQTIKGACINQTDSGCVLPTEMRSDICNGFYCDSLDNWQDLPREKRTDKVLAIQRSENYWNRDDLESSNHLIDVAFIDTETITEVTVNLDTDSN